MRGLLFALAFGLMATQAVAAEVKNFSVKGSTGYQGTVKVTTLPTTETETLFMNVEWTIAGYVLRGYGVVAKDEPNLLTVSFVVPVGLGVARYKIQPDGNVIGSLVGEKGIFVEEVWTYRDDSSHSKD